MRPILLTGIATLDIINQLDHYPDENTEVRAQKQNLQVGGNASNSAIVLQQLGHAVHLLATRADDAGAQHIFNELASHEVDTHLCPIKPNSTTPTSYITINTQNGSRSIVHFRDLDELLANEFTKINLSLYRWLHFEARNTTQLQLMLKHASPFNIPISLELEKPRENIDELMPYAQLLLISKPFALSRGFNCAVDCLSHFSQRFPEKTITSTWGRKGAWAYENGQIIHQPAASLNNIVETLGAGDTFNAAMIDSLSRASESHSGNQHNLKNSLAFACQLAEKKCQQLGFSNLSPTPAV